MTTNTYRVYLLTTTDPVKPAVHTVYVKAEKYGPAWEQARKLCSGKADTGSAQFTLDANGETPFTVPRDTVVAKISDMTVRNVKLDKTALQAILDDPSTSAEAKLAAMQGFMSTGKAPAGEIPAPEPEAAPAGSKGRRAAASEGAAA